MPPCFAAGAIPGSGLPSWISAAVSPMTKTSGCRGAVRSGRTCTRPARWAGAPSHFAAGEAATPAAHRIVPAVTQQCKLGAPRVQIGVYPRRPGGPYVVPQELRRDPEEGSPEVGGPKLVRGYATWA